MSAVAELIGTSDILCVPGNHDVDRNITNGQVVASLHALLRQCPVDEASKRLVGMLTEEDAADRLFQSHANYNDQFAKSYGCQISPAIPYWDRVYERDGWNLQIRGTTSTLVSNKDDDRNLVLGVGQVGSIDQPDAETITIVMSHHPTDWLRDGGEVDDALKARANLQLFGHKHRLRVHRNENSVVVVAGAVLPEDNSPDWNPTYNIIDVGFDSSEREPVVIEVTPRVWDQRYRVFSEDHHRGQSSRRYQLPWLDADIVRPQTASQRSPSFPQALSARSETPISELIADLPELAQLRTPRRGWGIAQR